MKDFMIIFLGKSYTELGLSPQDMQDRMGKWWAWQTKMEKDGVVKSGHALHPEIKQVVGPERTVIDRTATELKEIVGGYYIVQGNTMEDVIEIAQDYPDYDLGGKVEIREVMVFER